MHIPAARPPARTRTRAAALLLSASASIAALPAPALAQEAAPPSAASAARRRLVEVSLAPFHFDYEERQNGEFLDGEQGVVLRALAAALEIDGARWFGRFSARLAGGTVDYDGHVQSLDPAWNGLDTTAESDAGFLQGEVQMGRFLDAARRLALVGGVGARRWKREIRSTTVTSPSTGQTARVMGLDETYRWFELQVGLRAVVVETRAAEVTLEVRLVRTASPSMNVSIPGAGDVTFDLGARTGWRLGGSGRFAMSATSFVTAGAWAESYAFGASAVDPTYGAYEPSSTTSNVGLEVGVGTRF